MWGKNVLVVLLLSSVLIESSWGIINFCSAGKMWENYVKLLRANCMNCDKYFHCRANYEAVYECRPPLRRPTAKLLSDAREWMSKDPEDSKADQEANLFGRNGGNCSEKYLADFNCAYNPSTGECDQALP